MNNNTVGSHDWWVEKFTKGLPTIITSSRTGVPELHPDFIEALTQHRQAELAEVYREIKDAFKDQAEVGINHLNVELEQLALSRGIVISD